jgi:phenylpyruvate tautomerase
MIDPPCRGIPAICTREGFWYEFPVPLLRIQTNTALNEAERSRFLRDASDWVARELGKPLAYVQVTCETVPMSFGGTEEPAVFAELRALGLPADRTGELAARLTALCEARLSVRRDRVFLNFVDVPRHLWGWNGSTFA